MPSPKSNVHRGEKNGDERLADAALIQPGNPRVLEEEDMSRRCQNAGREGRMPPVHHKTTSKGGVNKNPLREIREEKWVALACRQS